jgi:hypothetical protein
VSENKSDRRRWRDFLFSPLVLIRVSSILFILLMVGHISAYPWTSTNGGPQETQLVAAMKTVEFIFLGASSTYFNLYFGWGLLVGLLLLTVAMVLWLLSDLARLAPRCVGAIGAVISAACSVGAYLSFRFFYIPPMLFFLAICVTQLIVAVRLLRRETIPADGNAEKP